ncbi:hypothetical protein UACE39S_03228 [Ureibacillus acetophenoni]
MIYFSARITTGKTEYGLTQIPVEWHNIIEEAMNLRKGIKVNIFSSDMERIDKTSRFSKFLITHCNSMIETKLS